MVVMIVWPAVTVRFLIAFMTRSAFLSYDVGGEVSHGPTRAIHPQSCDEIRCASDRTVFRHRDRGGPTWESKPEVGSSMKSSRGEMHSSTPMPSRRRSPPDIPRCNADPMGRSATRFKFNSSNIDWIC